MNIKKLAIVAIAATTIAVICMQPKAKHSDVNAKIYEIGYIECPNHFATSIYCENDEISHQDIVDADNAMSLENAWIHASWANTLADHVNSVYSGTCPITGKECYGSYRLWELTPGTQIHVTYVRPYGTVEKTYRLMNVDINAYIMKKTGEICHANGDNIDDIDNKDQYLQLISCWPSPSTNLPDGIEGRIVALFETTGTDTLTYADGSVAYGVYNLSTDTFIVE